MIQGHNQIGYCLFSGEGDSGVLIKYIDNSHCVRIGDMDTVTSGPYTALSFAFRNNRAHEFKKCIGNADISAKSDDRSSSGFSSASTFMDKQPAIAVNHTAPEVAIKSNSIGQLRARRFAACDAEPIQSHNNFRGIKSRLALMRFTTDYATGGPAVSYLSGRFGKIKKLLDVLTVIIAQANNDGRITNTTIRTNETSPICRLFRYRIKNSFVNCSSTRPFASRASTDAIAFQNGHHLSPTDTAFAGDFNGSHALLMTLNDRKIFVRRDYGQRWPLSGMHPSKNAKNSCAMVAILASQSIGSGSVIPFVKDLLPFNNVAILGGHDSDNLIRKPIIYQ